VPLINLKSKLGPGGQDQKAPDLLNKPYYADKTRAKSKNFKIEAQMGSEILYVPGAPG